METLAKMAPPGFSLDLDDSGHSIIRFRMRDLGRRQLGCAIVFMPICITCWTAFCFGLTLWMLHVGTLLFQGPVGIGVLHEMVMSAAFNVVFWAAEFFMIGAFTWFLFGTTIYALLDDRLIVQWRLGRVWRQRVFPKADVKAVKQIGELDQHGRIGGASLTVVTGGAEGQRVLARQNIEYSDWLGPLLADWAGTPFQPSALRPWQYL